MMFKVGDKVRSSVYFGNGYIGFVIYVSKYLPEEYAVISDDESEYVAWFGGDSLELIKEDKR